MNYAVIMAGGKGTRFWPISTPERPKQLLSLFDGQTMIEATMKRVESIIPLQNQKIVTIPEQVPLIQQHVKGLDKINFLIEPFAKNTAPCIGLAAVTLMKQDPDAIMVVLPADHRIDDEEQFREVLKRAIATVEQRDAIVTIGIKPTRPETGYGYIQYENEEISKGVHRIVTFAEKPNRDTAIRFLESGEFLWNSGIFVWSAKRIVSEIEDYLPELFAALMEIMAAVGTDEEEGRVRRAYQSIKPISIDYGVMEHTSHSYVVQGSFGWSDVGSWDEIYRISEKNDDQNVLRGQVYTIDTHDSYIISESSVPLAVVGMTGVIVVHTDEGILVCPRNRDQEVREVAEKVLKSRAQTEKKQ
ncbi:MAG: mannose-1-phosphate guanylyltransferase [bacterium]